MDYGADQQRLQISDLHFDKFPTPKQHLLVGKQDSKTEVQTCSQFPTEAMHWIKEVELVVLTSVQPTCGERRVPDTVLTPRFQSGPSAGNSFAPEELNVEQTN